MAFRKILIFLLPVLLTACAQIGVLSGGDEDIYAPKPLEEKMVPPNESVNFNGNKILIPFDEFILLNNPQQTIQLVPDHADVKATINKKDLKIEWDETLQPSTTYVIYLNGTVKDATEGNDSLITYVFSTGSQIDSLSYRLPIVDIQTSEALKDIQVGLFSHPDSLKPYYFAKSDDQGIATFNYLKKGNYYVRAFEDQNNDLTIQYSEKIGFRSEVLNLSGSFEDTIPLFISSVKMDPALSRLSYQAPGRFVLSANSPLKNSEIKMNGQILIDSSFNYYSNDSLSFVYPVKDLSEIIVTVDAHSWKDTATVRLIEKEKMSPLLIKPLNSSQTFAPSDKITFEVNGMINYVDTNLIKIVNQEDTLQKINFDIHYSNGNIYLSLDRKKLNKVKLTFLKGSVKGEIVSNTSEFSFPLQFLTQKDFGSINLDISHFEGSNIIEVIQNKKVVRSIVTDQMFIKIENLIPGDYSFRLIHDENGNGIWDGASFKTKEKSEMVHSFSTVTKVRANWEVDVKLEP